MYVHYKDNELAVRWRVYRGVSKVAEDFSHAKVVVFLWNDKEKIFVNSDLDDDGMIAFTVPSGLSCKVWNLELVWSKNFERSICRSLKDGAFMVTDVASEATYEGGSPEESYLLVETSAGTFGYDGLSAYELAVLKGKTVKSEDQWIQSAVETAEHEDARVAAEALRVQAEQGRESAAGNNIKTIEQTTVTTESGGENIITVTQQNDHVVTFSIYNGGQGEQGEQGPQGESGVSLGEVAVADDLTTNDSEKVLSAKQGYVLKNILDALVVDNLASTDSTKALSAKQGKVLNNEIQELDDEVFFKKSILSEFRSQAQTTVGNLIILDDGDIESTGNQYDKITYCQADKNSCIKFTVVNNGGSTSARTLKIASYSNIPANGESMIVDAGLLEVEIGVGETKEFEFFCVDNCYCAMSGYGLNVSVYINSATASRAVYVQGDAPSETNVEPLQIANQYQIASSGLISYLSGQNFYVYIFDVSKYDGKNLLITGSYNHSGTGNYLFSASKDMYFGTALDIVSVSQMHSSNKSANNNNYDLLKVENGIKYVAVSYNPASNVLPSVYVLDAEDSDVVGVPKEISASNIINDKLVAKNGTLSTASGQNLRTHIIHLDDYAGRTIYIHNGWINANNTQSLYSICSNSSFSSADDIEHVSIIRKYTALGDYYDFAIVCDSGYLAVTEKTNAGHPLSIVIYDDVRDYVHENRTRIEQLENETSVIPSMEEQIDYLADIVEASYDYDIIYWGDSLTVGNQDGKEMTMPLAVNEYLGKGTYLNCGIGGETINPIAFRQGGNTIIIPAGNINGYYGYNDLTDILDAPIGGTLVNQNDVGNTCNPVTLDNGYTCTISNDKANSRYVISDYEGGPTDIPIMARSKGSGYTSKIAVIWAGANGIIINTGDDAPFTNDTAGMMDAMIVYIDSMISHLGHENYIVIGHISQARQAGSGLWDDVYDQRLKKYGNKFLQARRYLGEWGLTYNNLTPCDNCMKAYKRSSSVVRTLEDVSNVSLINATTLRIAVTNTKGVAVSADGDYIDVQQIESYSLSGTTLTYKSVYEIVMEDEVQQISDGYIPCRLLYDSIHLTHYGYKALGAAVAKRMIALGYSKLISD